jgi:hypothetical protein
MPEAAATCDWVKPRLILTALTADPNVASSMEATYAWRLTSGLRGNRRLCGPHRGAIGLASFRTGDAAIV